jgi:hypothetical protein
VNETPLTHEQFAWLMSLPPDHPERIAWSGRPEFESMRSLYEQFEGARPSNFSERGLREAEVALERRFRDALPSESRVDAAPSRPAAGPRRPSRPWWIAFPRPALAMAAVVVAVAGIWFATRPRSTTLRGAQDAPVILEPRHVAEGLEIRWTPVAGAASYRLSFVDDSMREIAAVEAWPATRYSLKASALPPGLEHGAKVIMQVQPVRGGAAEGAVATRSIRVP